MSGRLGRCAAAWITEQQTGRAALLDECANGWPIRGTTEMPLRRFARGSLLSGNTSNEVQPEGIISVSHETSYVYNGLL